MKNEDRAEDQALAQYETLCAMLDALDVDYERLQELREKAQKPRFVAGWNMPGYMPDSEPVEFDNADDALDYIKSEMRRDAEENAPEFEVDSLLARIDTFEADAEGEFGIGFLAYHYFVTRDGLMPLNKDEAEELRELEEQSNGCADADEARQRIEEDPLSVEVRSDWSAPGEPLEAGEFRILLCTGGPAVQIRGELNRGEPCRAWLEYQDWGTPWTQYFGADSDTLCRYASFFFFGE